MAPAGTPAPFMRDVAVAATLARFSRLRQVSEQALEVGRKAV